jgi:hypothetical protein
MDDYIDEDIPPGLPLSAADLALAHFGVPRKLGTLPFGPDDKITRSLWVPDPDGIAVDCGVIARMMERPLPDEIAFVVLRRPGPAEISEADQYILRVLCHAAAGRQTAPWRFYVTGPDGVRRVR